MNNTFIIALNHIKKKFVFRDKIYRIVLSDVTFDITNNDFITIGGPSGSGKTTILKIISSQLPYDSGSISFENVSSDEIVFLQQEGNLIPYLTVFENVNIGCENENTANELLSMLQINNIRNNLPDEISGGESRRTKLARCLSLSPKILLLDEPNANIDKKNSNILNTILLNIWKKGISIVLVSHDKSLLQLGNIQYLLVEGKLVSQNSSSLRIDGKISL